MKVVEITGPRECRLVERSRPRIADNYALVEVQVAPMCTEVHQYKNGDLGDCWGHEAAGIVIESATGLSVKEGQRVVVMPQNGCGKCSLCLRGEYIRCQNPRDPLAVCGSETGRATYAQLLIQQDWLLLPIPDDISTEYASMACCGLGPTFGAMQAMVVDTFDTVLISGLGPVGLGGVVNAVIRGARVIGVEGNPYRAALARAIGAFEVIDPNNPNAVDRILELTNGLGADKSIEASSQESAPSFLISATRRGGQMSSVGWGGPIRMAEVVARGVTIRGNWHWNHLHDMDRMFETIRRASPLLDTMITHRFPMSRAQDAWETQVSGHCGKVILDPWS